MGFSRKRIDRHGRPRYTAYYVDARRRELSAGTFATRRDADSAWRAVEAARASGRPMDPRRGLVTFQHYVEHDWFPHHVTEASTRQSNHYVLQKHLMPTFGPMRIGEILPIHVRTWVAEREAAGTSPATVKHAKILLSAIFTTAVNDLVIGLHPCRGVKTPRVPVQPYRILTIEEYDRLHEALPTPSSKALVELLVESGLRWGEATELRLRDVDINSGIITVARSVVQVDPKFHPAGDRFVVKPYPKNGHARRFKLRPSVLAVLAEHASGLELKDDDLLFALSHFHTDLEPHPTLEAGTLGMTTPNALGRTYAHGSLSAYTAGRCRCADCRGTFARYRAKRRAEGLDEPRSPRMPSSDGHVPAQWFRESTWHPACARAGIVPAVRLHDLRHTHASWLLAGGADVQVVKERLGHTSLVTTEKYLHTLPTADESALEALSVVRARSEQARETP